tara:strand:+ start:66 stop:272 length:207 start_codon:yes stop_codon:yes gene_type:complete
MGNAYMKWRDRENTVPDGEKNNRTLDGAKSPAPSTSPPPKDKMVNPGTPASNVFDTSLSRGGIQPVHF